MPARLARITRVGLVGLMMTDYAARRGAGRAVSRMSPTMPTATALLMQLLASALTWREWSQGSNAIPACMDAADFFNSSLVPIR